MCNMKLIIDNFPNSLLFIYLFIYLYFQFPHFLG